MATQSNHREQKKSNPPSALLIFSEGFNSLPTVVPNGGSEELDNHIVRWLERKLGEQESSDALRFIREDFEQ